MKAPLFTKSGTKSTTQAELSKAVFEAPIKSHTLMHQAVRAYTAHQRNAGAVTLTRGKVSGGGKKPWAQKGTGRARVGSSRSPIWRAGGVVFGPTGAENYQIKLPQKAKRTAIRQALSVKAKAGEIIVIEDLELKAAKTKEVTALLSKLGVGRRVLVVVDKKTDSHLRATNNLTHTKLVSAAYLNVFDLLTASHVILTKPAIIHIENWLGAKKSTESVSKIAEAKPKAKSVRKAA